MKYIIKIASLVLLFHLYCTSQSFAQAGSKPLIFGITDSFQSKILNEIRVINIYLPEDFNAEDSVQYPVIYIPDGGVEEDFFHITGMVRYNTQPWVHRFPKSIVVGIENTNRQRDFTFPVASIDFVKKKGFKKESFPQYGGSEKYIAFLEKELQPYMANKYKGRRQQTIIGESLAGLLTTEILLKHTHLFSNYIIISPSLWWGEEQLLKESIGLIKTSRIKVYVGAPNKAEDVEMYNEATALFKALQANKQIHSVFDYLPNELHSTVIHQAVYNAFKMLYPKTAYSK